ncbi:DUF1850 domain-containing protein [Paracoccus suum]|uniref:DUF1850 domain-containing protein n=1 Tax=Paracoccus suum TaxID=2259340 RepID=A0A344PJS1_9RHOB|nr:DUF1850 domain-containing protein [Paracoccus suum]AXC49626.1 DUF1850 domain-containing protein [Paracoccus suum]
MSGGCLLVGALALTASHGFALEWTHSVQRTSWREQWRVADSALVLESAAVRSSGAGMEPGDGAVLRGGWWVWPVGRPVPEVVLAASGTTGAGWRLCVDAGCVSLGATAGAPVHLAPCAQ